MENFISEQTKLKTSITLPNGLILCKYKNNIAELRIDSYHKSGVTAQLDLSKSSFMIFDDIFMVETQVYSPGPDGKLHYYINKSSVYSDYIPPVLSINHILVSSQVFPECLTFTTRDFKSILIFKPPRKLLF
jgi:hypothetical protein